MGELLYADDTLLMSANGSCVGRFLQALQQSGANFGLSLHGGINFS